MSKSTLRQWLKSGVPHYKFGGAIRIKVSEFDAWVEKFRSSANAAITSKAVQSAWDAALRRTT
jgi:excisionase family DNA binding protein